MRPQANVVTLFDSIPNKVLEWREKWLYVECTHGFSFPPLVRNLEAWRPVGKKPNYSEYDRKFLNFVKSELGYNPKNQTKVFSTTELLEPKSRHWCGIRGPQVEVRHKLLGLTDDNEYPACRVHTAPNSAGCLTNKCRT